MVRIGKIVATHGLGGDVIVTHVAGRRNWLKKNDVLFVALRRDSHIPFFVTQVRSPATDELIVHLDETDTVEAARKLIGREVFIKEDILVDSGATDSPLLWIGFQLVDVATGPVGLIRDVFQTPTQWLAEVDHEGHEVLVPLVEPVLRKADVRRRTVEVELPDGLLDVYRK